MKKLPFILILFCFAATLCFPQKRPSPSKLPNPKTVSAQTAAEISDADWRRLADTLFAEDWEKSTSLTAEFINRIKIDNEKKQLAQLRYLYLYALAGKILKLHEAKNAGGEATAWSELKKASISFTG